MDNGHVGSGDTSTPPTGGLGIGRTRRNRGSIADRRDSCENPPCSRSRGCRGGGASRPAITNLRRKDHHDGDQPDQSRRRERRPALLHQSSRSPLLEQLQSRVTAAPFSKAFNSVGQPPHGSPNVLKGGKNPLMFICGHNDEAAKRLCTGDSCDQDFGLETAGHCARWKPPRHRAAYACSGGSRLPAVMTRPRVSRC